MGLPVPNFYSFHPAINYLSVHLICTILFYNFPGLLNSKLLDTIFWPLDALLRTNAVTSTQSLLAHPLVPSEYKLSPLTHLILGAIASAGGGISVGTINGFSSSWAFATPPFLRLGAGWAGTLDVWGGALVALIYGCLIGDPAFNGLITLASATSKTHTSAVVLPLTPLAAKAIAGIILGGLFATRTVQTHWMSTTPQRSKTPVGVPVLPPLKMKKKTAAKATADF